MAVQRTPVTWSVYAATGAWAAFIYLAGPVSPVLVDDLGVAAASAGLIGTALAVGSITAAAGQQAAVRRMGRGGVMRLGLGIAAVGIAALSTLPRLLDGWPAFALVLALVWLTSVGGTLTLNVGTTRLSDLHPEHSGVAITEANATAAWVGVFSPLVLGAALGAGLGWWVGFWLALVLALAALTGLVLADRNQRAQAAAPGPRHRTMTVADELYEAPESEDAESEGTDAAPSAPKALPRRFWIAMVALFAAVGAEFSVNFLGSTLIQDHTGSSTSEATSALAASILGIAVGRTVGTRVTGRLGPHRTLISGFVLALLGFAVLWSASVLAVAVVGLFLGGLGLATLFPLIVDRGIGLSGGHPDLAMSRASYVTGTATGGAPFALGALGDVVSVSTAMLLVPVLIGAGLVGVIASQPAGQ